MTYGHWLQRGHDALTAARDATLQHPPASADDADVLAVARRRCYHGLARLTELLAGPAPVRVDVSRDDAEEVLDAPRPSSTKLYLGLHVAGTIDAHATTGDHRAAHVTRR